MESDAQAGSDAVEQNSYPRRSAKARRVRRFFRAICFALLTLNTFVALARAILLDAAENVPPRFPLGL
ncbi:MAG: hypothetical protein AB1716_18395 [Planctomycetota bacterium]